MSGSEAPKRAVWVSLNLQGDLLVPLANTWLFSEEPFSFYCQAFVKVLIVVVWFSLLQRGLCSFMSSSRPGGLFSFLPIFMLIVVLVFLCVKSHLDTMKLGQGDAYDAPKTRCVNVVQYLGEKQLV